MPQQSKQTALGAATGSFGSDYIDDTSTYSVDLDYQNTDGTPSGYVYKKGFKAWQTIEAKADTVFATLTYHPDWDGDQFDTSDTLTSGQKIRGLFTVIDLTSGAVDAFRV